MRYSPLISEKTQTAIEELGIILPKTKEKGNIAPFFQAGSKMLANTYQKT